MKYFLPSTNPVGVRAIFPDGVLRQYKLKSFQQLYIEKRAPAFTPTTSPKSAAFYGNNTNVQLDKPSAQMALPDGNCHIFSANPSRVSANNCSWGKSSSKLTVALVGDSHAAQWFPALKTLANQGKFKLYAQTRDSCSLHNRGLTGEVKETQFCLTWKKNIIAWINKTKPDILLLNSRVKTYSISTDAEYEAMKELLSKIPSKTKTVILRDNPDFGTNVATCVQKHLDNPASCSAPKKQVVDETAYNAHVKLRKTHTLRILDINKYLCTSSTCHPVQGNVLALRDHNHLAKGYTQKMYTPLWNELKSLKVV